AQRASPRLPGLPRPLSRRPPCYPRASRRARRNAGGAGMNDDHDTECDDHQQRVTEAVERWLAGHDPLSRAEFDRINRALIQNVGAAVDHPTWGHNVRCREADAQAFGQFAHEHDVALVELDTDARYGDLHGYPIGREAGWVPVLVTTDDSGEVADAVQRIHDSFHAAETLVGNGHTRKVVTDGGQPNECGTLGCENEPVVNGYCRECTDISPGILDDDDGDE